jgi:hypothetical protein
VIVSTRLLRGWVNGKPEELLLSYDDASSWIPGVIRMRGLSMRGSDPNVQWFFRMEKATISVSLLDLFRRRFHATRVRAEGLVFRLREKQTKKNVGALCGAPAVDRRLLEIRRLTPVSRRRRRRRRMPDRPRGTSSPIRPRHLGGEIYRFRSHARWRAASRCTRTTARRSGPRQWSFCPVNSCSG